jgi:uncharacterized protein YkwD
MRSIRPRSAGALLAVVLLAVAAAGCMPAEERTFLDRTNGLRAQHGLPGLSEHGVLTDKAEGWAQHLAATGKLEHSSLTSGLDGLAWRALAENVGVSTPTADTLLTLHERLASSPHHRANLLDGRMTHMGVGVATSADGRVWVVEVFAAL